LTVVIISFKIYISMSAERSYGFEPEHNAPILREHYVAGFDSYLADAEREQILRPDQEAVFRDIQGFIGDGGTKGYVTAPTGTGKTVIFVELTKALLAAEHFAGRPPRILVVEPKIDLVLQTLGRSGERGYGKFAQNLDIATYYSGSSTTDRRLLSVADVVVTTYDSLSLMSRRDETREMSEEEKLEMLKSDLDDITGKYGSVRRDLTGQFLDLSQRIKSMGTIPTGRTLLDAYDVIIFDEAHHILGETAADIVDKLGNDKLVIGFTATPNASARKKLDNHLPTKIHDLTFKEAMSMDLLAPLATVGLLSNTKISGEDLYDKEGDYREGSLDYLIASSGRNQLILNAAKILVEHGFGTLIPCVASKGALHARIIAEELNRMGITAAAVHSGVPPKTREGYYEQFENGELDVLTNIRILGEGFDSTRAKAIIEASPTRSMINKRQRVGRIVRPGDIAVGIDIIDQYDRNNPPIHLADIMSSGSIESGMIYGNATPEQRERVGSLIEALGRQAIIAELIPGEYSVNTATLEEFQNIVRGHVAGVKTGHYSTADKISPVFKDVSDEIMSKIWEMEGKSPDVTLGRHNFTVRILFHTGESVQLLRKTPVCERNRAYVEEDVRWMSAEGFVIGFQKKFPDLDIELMEDIFRSLGDDIDWRPLKNPLLDKGQMADYALYKAYRADKDTISRLSGEIEKTLSVMNGEKRADNC
jgi:superfamily II DNA or RNA helicase